MNKGSALERYDQIELGNTSLITKRGENVQGIPGYLVETPSLAGREMIFHRSMLLPYPDQPRKHFPDKELEDLSHDLKTAGQIMPIVVTPYWHEDSQSLRFMIVDGEMRYRASELAGIDYLKVIVHTHLTEASLYKAAASTHKDSTKMTRTDRVLMMARLYEIELADRPGLQVNEYATEIQEGYNNIHDGLRIKRLDPKLIEWGVQQRMPCTALIYLANRKIEAEKQKKSFPEVKIIKLLEIAFGRQELAGQKVYLSKPEVEKIYQKTLISSGSGPEAMKMAFTSGFELALQSLRAANKRGDQLFELVPEEDDKDPTIVALFAGMTPSSLRDIARVVRELREKLDNYDSLIGLAQGQQKKS